VVNVGRTRATQIGVLGLAVVAVVTVSVLSGRSSGGAAPEQLVTGIQVDREAPPYRSQTFATSDRWLGEVNGQLYEVYAGAKLLPARGVPIRSELLLYAARSTGGNSGPSAYVGAYLPPGGGREPLRISSSHGDVLNIRTSAGAELSFDVARRAFVSH
jgi:hypothetical protein